MLNEQFNKMSVIVICYCPFLALYWYFATCFLHLWSPYFNFTLLSFILILSCLCLDWLFTWSSCSCCLTNNCVNSVFKGAIYSYYYYYYYQTPVKLYGAIFIYFFICYFLHFKDVLIYFSCCFALKLQENLTWLSISMRLSR